MCVSVCLGHLNSGLLVCSVVSEWVSKEEGRESDYIVIYYCIYTFNIHYTYWGGKMTPEALCRPLVWYALHPIGMVWDVCSIPVGSPSFLATLMHCSTESRLLLFGDMKPPPGPQVTRCYSSTGDRPVTGGRIAPSCCAWNTTATTTTGLLLLLLLSWRRPRSSPHTKHYWNTFSAGVPALKAG